MQVEQFEDMERYDRTNSKVPTGLYETVFEHEEEVVQGETENRKGLMRTVLEIVEEL